MALRKATRSIPLVGGISDNVDDFLLQPPAVAYSENCHWRGKDGKLVKRLGSFRSSPSISSNQTPSVLHAIDDTLYTFTESRSYALRNGTWTNKEQIPFFATNERVATSPTRGGISCHSIYKTSGGQLVLAYTIKVQPGTGTTAADRAKFRSFVATYATDGTIITTTEIEPTLNATTRPSEGPVAPKIIQGNPGAGIQTYIVYADASTVANQNAIYTRALNLTDGSLGAATKVADDVYCESISAFGDSTAAGIGSLPSIAGAATGYPYFCVSSHEGGLRDPAGVGRVLAWTNATTGDINVIESNDAFLTATTSFTIAAADYGRPLAIAHRLTDAPYYIMYGSHTDLGGGSLQNVWRVAKYPLGSSTVDWTRIILDDSTPDNNGEAIRGALAYEPTSDRVYYAAEDNGATTNQSDQALTLGYIADAAPAGLLNQQILNGHRVVTDMVASGGRVYVGEQMFVDGEGVLLRAAAHTDTADRFLATLQPVTTAIVDITDITAPAVASCLDTRQSKHTDITDAWHNQHLGTLMADLSDSDTLVVSNREVSKAEDFFSITNASATTTIYETVAGEARINGYEITLSTTAALSSAALGDGLIISSGVPSWFDGDVLCELSPIDAPIITSVNDNVGQVRWGYEEKASFGASDQFRTLQAVCGYTDVKGNVHRSPPSALVTAWGLVPGTTTSTPWTESETVSVTVAVPLSTNPAGNTGRYFVEVYVSETESSTPKLAAREYYTPDGGAVELSFPNNALSGTTNEAQTITRQTPFVYTEGDVLESTPWPNFSQVLVTSQRMWALSAEDSGQVYYSKRFEPFISPEFSNSLVLNFADERRLTAIGKLDDKIVVFEENDVHVVYGPGPDNTGEAGRQGGFEVHHVTSDVGCDDQDSIVEIPMGLIFKSRRGFYMLDRGLQLHFIGGGVEDITANTRVRCAAVVPEFAEVRFHLTSTGAQVPELGPDPLALTPARPPRPRYGNVLPTDGCVVYNYEFQRWTVFSNYPAAACTLFQGKYTRILDNWDVYTEAEETDDHWIDTTQPLYYMKILTPWVPVAENIQGYSRIYDATVLGRYMSSWAEAQNEDTMAGDLKITPYYDFEAVAGTPETLRANVYFQESDRGRAERFQFRFRPNRGKCQSIQFLIEEVDTVPTYVNESNYTGGRGFEVVAIDLNLGIKEGPVRTLGAERKR